MIQQAWQKHVQLDELPQEPLGSESRMDSFQEAGGALRGGTGAASDHEDGNDME